MDEHFAVLPEISQLVETVESAQYLGQSGAQPIVSKSTGFPVPELPMPESTALRDRAEGLTRNEQVLTIATVWQGRDGSHSAAHLTAPK
jgi:hypothetical protein